MKKLDLTGQTFGMLTVIKEAEPHITPGGRKKIQWLCHCECGREKIAETSNLRGGHTTNCGCKTGKISHIGETFGRLLAKEYITGGYYLCECSCGNVVKVKTANLVNGNTSSCGCLQKERASEVNHISLVGQTFDRLTVLERDKTVISPYVMYRCQCECGSIVVVNAQNLRTGTTKSCGCLKKELTYKRSKKDLLNQRFGKLVVVEETPRREEGSIIWQCLCDCGNITYISSRNLLHARVASCGCLLSKGEEFIATYLRNKNIPFVQQYTFDDCLSPNGRKLRFDFFVLNQILIEYDGSQHYNFTGYDWNTEENYQKTVINDKIKNEYCKNHNLKLIRIPYWDYDNLENILQNIIKELNLEVS